MDALEIIGPESPIIALVELDEEDTALKSKIYPEVLVSSLMHRKVEDIHGQFSFTTVFPILLLLYAKGV